MKNILLSASFLAISAGLSAQCTLTGLNSFYCTSDSSSTLSASCSGGSPTILGAGVSGNTFDPSVAGPGTHNILVFSGGVTYTVTQQGTYSFESTTNGTSVSLGDDQVSSACSLGFSFNFFGTAYTQFYISSNGFITFSSSSGNGCCSGQYLPNSGDPNLLIAAAWEDFNPGSGGTIKYQTMGTAPNRRCLISYENVPHYGSGGGNLTSQIKLYEGCGIIEIHTTSMQTDGGTHTQGIENSSGSVGYALSGRNATSFSMTNDYVKFIPTCGDTFTTTVSGGPDLVWTLDTLNCYSDTTGQLTVVPSGSNPFTYLWSSGATTATASGLSGGTYTVSVTDDDGCTKVESGHIDSPLPLTADLTSTNTVCESSDEGTATAAGLGGTPPYSYVWNTGGTTATITNLTAGTYTVTVVDDNDCQLITSIEVDFTNADPVVNLGADRTLCPGQQIVLVAPPGYPSYAWSQGGTSNSIVVGAAGVYSLTATNSAGCSGSDEVEVFAVVPDYVDLGPNQSGLAPIVLDAGPQYSSYLWNTGGTTQSISVVIPGDYHVQVVDSTNCVSRDTVNVKIWTVGIGENTSENNLLVFPNPAKEVFMIRSSEGISNATLTMMDMVGKEVKTMNLNLRPGQDFSVDIRSLPAGNYTLILSNDDLREERVISVQ